MIPDLEDHPLAAIFPLFDAADLEALADDIEANGLRDPIYMLDGKILDGRNRYRACVLKELDCHTVNYKGKDPLAFVLSKNLHRRHLSTSQRAMVAANIEQLSHGGDRKTDQDANLHLDRDEAAKSLNVSPRSVADAAKVLEKGTPELQAAVASGAASVSAAATVADLPKKEQRKAVKDGVAKAAKKAKEEVAVLCQRCKVGPVAKNCPWCAEDRDAKKKPAKKPDPAPDGPVDAMADGVAAINAFCTRLDQVKNDVKRFADDTLWRKFVHAESIATAIEAARKALWQSRPTEPCKCGAVASCKACHGTGKQPACKVLRGAR